MAVKVYTEQDADLSVLNGKKIAVIGYGSQGHAHALNLQDSGMDVRVGLRQGSKNWAKAEEAGLKVMTVEDASKEADIIMILINDEFQGDVYRESIAPGLVAGNALVFGHGFNIHFGQIKPPADVDVFMVAPKGPGHLVRRQFLEGRGVPCLIAIAQDATGHAKELALAWAKGIGGARAGVLETSFREETETDLFGEQAVLCGGTTALVKAGFETLTEAGYAPEIAYFECLHELKLIVDLMYEAGIAGMRYSISDTAQYGDMTRGPRLINSATKDEMRKILGEIQSGEFAKAWIQENKDGRPNFNRLADQDKDHLVEQTGKHLRGLFAWIKPAATAEETVDQGEKQMANA